MMRGMNMKIAEVITVNRLIEIGFKSDWLRKKIHTRDNNFSNELTG